MTIATDLASVLTDVTHAKGLPNAHYTSAEVFEEEKHALLFAHWSGLGFGKDVPNPGDVKPIDFLGIPLILVRDHEGAIRVFQNTCRHRGMILVEEAKNIQGALRCPYHSWCYSLKGQLRATPHVGGPGQNLHEGIDRDALGLTEIRHHVWHDVVFVNIDDKAPPFEEAHATLLERWKEFEQPVAHSGPESSFKFERVGANWKLAVENYCESYHLPWIHPGLNSYSRLEDHYHIEEPGLFSGQGSWVYRQMEGAEGQKFPDFDGLSDYWDTGAEYVSLFPNVLLAVHRDHFYAMVIEPHGPDSSTEHVEIYYTEEGAKDPSLAEMRAENAERWQGVLDEDIFVVEGMQRGRHGVLFDGGKFSPAMDGPTHVFHHWVASNVSAYRARG